MSEETSEERTRRLSDQEWIRARAQQLWNQNGQPYGRDDEFWLQAEKELQAQKDREKESGIQPGTPKP